MAVPAGVPMEIRAVAVFYGRDTDPAAKDGLNAEDFLRNIQSLKDTHHLNDADTCTRAIWALRGAAGRWFRNFADTWYSKYDTARLRTDWEYFKEIFRNEFFVAGHVDTDYADDCSSVKQHANEPIRAFHHRLEDLVHPLSNRGLQSSIQTMRDLTNQQIYDSLPNNIRTFFEAIDGDVAFQHQVRTYLVIIRRGGDENGAKVREGDARYEMVSRTLARNAYHEKMREFLRGQILNVNKDIKRLLDMATTREREFLPIAHSTSYSVAAVDDASTDADPQDVDAATRGKGYKPRGRGGKQQRGGKGAGKSSDGLPRGEDMGCAFCRVDSHQLEDCNRMRRLLVSRGCAVTIVKNAAQANASQFGAGQPGRGRGNYRGGRGPPRGGHSAFTGLPFNPNAMDTSAVPQWQGQQEQQPAQYQYYEAYPEEQQSVAAVTAVNPFAQQPSVNYQPMW